MSARVRGRALVQARLDLFRDHPYCERCADDGREVLATVRKHIVPFAEGGTDDLVNIVALCLDCAQVQKADEASRGVSAFGFTERFTKSATPRDATGHFSVRRATRLQQPDADTPTPPPLKAGKKRAA